MGSQLVRCFVGKMTRRGHSALARKTKTINQERGGSGDVEIRFVRLTVPSVSVKMEEEPEQV